MTGPRVTSVTRHFYCSTDIFEDTALYVEANPGMLAQLLMITAEVFGPTCSPAWHNASQLAATRSSDGFSYCYWINREVAAFEQQEPILSLHTAVLSKWKTRIRSTQFPRSLSLGYYLLAVHVTCIPRKCLPLLLDTASDFCMYVICW